METTTDLFCSLFKSKQKKSTRHLLDILLFNLLVRSVYEKCYLSKPSGQKINTELNFLHKQSVCRSTANLK